MIKKIKYLPLGRKKDTIREISRNNLLKNENDPYKAIDDTVLEIKTGSIISSILIGLAIKLAIELIWYWFNNRIKQPSIFYLPEEPGY